MKRLSYALVAGVFLFFAGKEMLSAQPSAIPFSVFGSGYASQSGTANQVRAIVGQIAVGTSSGSGLVITSGFFPGSLGNGTTDVVPLDEPIPLEFALTQNYPNPFNPTTTVKYDLPTQSHVTVRIFDALGREVRTLVDEHQVAGRYQITWDGNSSSGTRVSSGMYIYRMQASTGGGTAFIRTMKMLMLK